MKTNYVGAAKRATTRKRNKRVSKTMNYQGVRNPYVTRKSQVKLIPY